MPDYAVVQQQMADLRAQYQAETKRVEDEFNRKYEDFLDGENRYAALKITFPENAEKLFKQASDDAMERYKTFKKQEEM